MSVSNGKPWERDLASFGGDVLIPAEGFKVSSIVYVLKLCF